MLLPISYWLDTRLTVARVSDGWDAAALANGGERATAEHVVGKPLEQFIDGADTWRWARGFLDEARSLGAPLERDYRCDTPFERRLFRMRAVQDGDLLRVDHFLERVDPFEIPMHFEPSQAFRHRRYKRCVICSRIRTRGSWFEPDAYTIPPSRPERPVRVYPMVCPDCAATTPANEQSR